MDICRGRTPPADIVSAAAGELVRAARYHRIAPLTHVALRDGSPEIAEVLKPDRDQALWHHTRVLALLAELDTTLGDISWLAFKGPVLSEFAHPRPGLRSYKDLDLLVDPRDLREACARLFEHGWNIIDSNETLRAPQLSGEVRMANQRRILTDLHWSMVVTVRRRQMFDITSPALLERRRRLQTGTDHLWTLDLVDQLVHVCLHAALSGATRMLHLLDADQLARQVEDWDAVAERAREWGAAAQTALVLGRARRVLHTPAPADLYPRLGLSRALARAMSGVDRTWPIESVRQDESFPRLVARAVRPGVGRTAVAVARSMTLGALHRLRPKAPPSPRIPADDQAIEDYLAAVEATAR